MRPTPKRRWSAWRVTVALLGLACGGCGDPGSDPGLTQDAASDAGLRDGPMLDAESGVARDGGFALVDGSTVSGQVTLPNDLTVTGSGTARVGAVTLGEGVGTLILGAPLPALAYRVTDWPAYGYILAHLLVPEPQRLHVLYLYCDQSQGLPWIWHESYDHVMDYEEGSGSCAVAPGSVTVDVTLLALEALPGSARLAQGFAVTGPKVSVGTGGGLLDLEEGSYALYPFEVVDCSTECTADPVDGWWELHLMLEEQVGGELCFGILYLYTAHPGTIDFAYGFCLGTLSPLEDAVLEGDWSRVGMAAASPSLIGPRVAGRVLRPHPRAEGRLRRVHP